MMLDKIKKFFFEKKKNKYSYCLTIEKNINFAKKEQASEIRLLFKDFVGLPEIIRLRNEFNERNLPKEEKFPCFYR